MSEVYLYDEITSEKWFDFDGAVHGFTPNDLSEALGQAEPGDTVDIYVNSPGGSVFAAVAMTSEIKRALQRGVIVNAYVDGIAASAASFLIMSCRNVYMYSGTMLMVHKPMSVCFGNADDMLKCAEDLEQIQEATCMPMYLAKLKGDEEDLRAMIAKETWLSAKQANELFTITVIDGAIDPTNLYDESVFAKYGYRNVPDAIKNRCEEPVARQRPRSEPVDYSDYEKRIQEVTR